MYAVLPSFRARHTEGLESILTKIECDSTQSVMTQCLSNGTHQTQPVNEVQMCLSLARSQSNGANPMVTLQQ